MYNIPSDATVNGCDVFHEGNHGRNGNPHEQYINTINYYRTLSSKTDNVNKMCKIATIKYIPNVSVNLKYEIEVKTHDNKINSKIVICCGSVLTNSKVYFIGDNSEFDVVIKQSNYLDELKNDTYNVLDIYLTLKREWEQLYYRVLSCDNTEYYHYTKEHAFNAITLFSEKDFTENTVSDITIRYDKKTYYYQVENQLTNIPANTTKKITLNVQNAKWENHVDLICCGEIPLEFSVWFSVPYTNAVYLYARNNADYQKDFPVLKWNARVTEK